jgi:MFS transporter, SP family, sugar:H+ symporter
LLKGKKDLALRNLEKLRKKEEVTSGYVAAEIDAIEEAIAVGYSQDTDSWWKSRLVVPDIG